MKRQNRAAPVQRSPKAGVHIVANVSAGRIFAINSSIRRRVREASVVETCASCVTQHTDRSERDY